MTNTFDVKLEENELQLLLSSLLFFGSVNIVSDSNQVNQNKLIDLALKLKAYKPDIQLTPVQYLKEDEYEDQFSEKIFSSFSSNIKTITFDKI